MTIPRPSHEPLSNGELLAIPGVEVADWERLPAAPLVSVLMITWRHERWIADAVAGVVAQRCPFPIELLIGEDCSPDATLRLCKEAQARHPQLIRLIYSERNLGAKRNNMRLRARARGRYLALCEGDDYWTDPDKLAKQVAVLEADPTLTGCCSMVEVHQSTSDGQVVGRRLTPNVFRPRWELKHLLASRSQPHTCSLMYRSGAIRLPRWFADAAGAHKEQLLLHANAGPIACLPDITAVYRHHGSGLASGASRLQLLRRDIFRQRHVAWHLARPARDRLVANLVSAMLEMLGLLAARRTGWPHGRRALRTLLAWGRCVRPLPWRRLPQALLGIHAPPLHDLLYHTMLPRLQATAFYSRYLAAFRRSGRQASTEESP